MIEQETASVRTKAGFARARCVGCSRRFKTKSSKYGVCARCNPVRYTLQSDGSLVASLSGNGAYRMAVPFPALRQPGALAVLGGKTYLVLPYAQPWATWWMAPFTTYRKGDVVMLGGEATAIPRANPVMRALLFLRRVRWCLLP